jgi:hypothetical protein
MPFAQPSPRSCTHFVASTREPAGPSNSSLQVIVHVVADGVVVAGGTTAVVPLEQASVATNASMKSLGIGKLVSWMVG